MKKILFVMNTMGRAGAERALIALMNTLSPEEYDISLFVLINRGEIFDEVPSHVTILNRNPDCRSVLTFGGRLAIIRTTLHCFFYRMRGFSLLGYLFHNFRCQQRKHRIQPDKLLWRIIARGSKSFDETYDLAVAYLEGASTYYVADYVHAKKKASFVHIDYEKAGYTKDLDLDAYAKIDHIFSVSREAGESFCHIYPEYKDKVSLFRNLHDKESIKSKSLLPIPESSPFVQSQAKYKLLTVGRLNYQKAYDIAIEALQILRSHGMDIDWFVLGEGSLENELRTQISHANLTNHFHLLGSVANPYPYYRAATLYIHATRFEGKSIAIEEAQILGKAIIASDCTGNREQIISGETGTLVTLSAHEVAKSIETLLSQPDTIQSYEKASKAINLTHHEDQKAFLDLLKD